MSGKKFYLTNKKDSFTGTSGNDLFLAPSNKVHGQYVDTLSQRDVLNGGRGFDTLRADISATSLKPVLTNIENAVFTHVVGKSLDLDLSKAQSLTSLTFAEKVTSYATPIEISHATNVSKFTFKDSESKHIALSGIDADKVTDLKISVKSAEVGLDLQTLNSATFKTITYNMSSPDYSAVSIKDGPGAETLKFNIQGDAEYDEAGDFSSKATKQIIVAGDGDFGLVTELNDKLISYDSSAMSGATYAQIGGSNLVSVTGGSANDQLRILDLGGQIGAKATVSLGAGRDEVLLQSFDGLNADLHSFDGGSGKDWALISGAIDDFGAIFKNFEYLTIYDGAGNYDLAGSNIEYLGLRSQSEGGVASSFAVSGLVDGSTVEVISDILAGMSVSVENSVGNLDDSLNFDLHADAGASTAGVMLADLDNLSISNTTNRAQDFWLGTVGSAASAATVTIDGDYKINLGASSGSTSYIDTLVITNAGGADILNLANGYQAFVETGALIKGGAGNDALVGGVGADNIYTGKGANVVHSSLGEDTIHLSRVTAKDILFYDNAYHSNQNGFDTVHDFAANDRIDVGAIVSSLNFAGNAASFADGEALLSDAVSTAFFDQAEDMLYIDVNHDGKIDANQDLALHLVGVDALSADNFLF